MLSSFTIALLCGMAFADDSTEVKFKNIYHMSGATLQPGYGGDEILKAGGQIAWEVKKNEANIDALFMYQTIGVNIDQNYGKNANDDEDTDEETDEKEDPVESPAKARIQVGLCAPSTAAKANAMSDLMMCSLVEFQKDTKKILVRNWQQDQSQIYPVVTDMSQSLTKPLWTDFHNGDGNRVFADLTIDMTSDEAVVTPERIYAFGILTSHVTADWDSKLEVTLYQEIFGNNADFIKLVKEGFSWNGRSYLSAYDQQDLDDDKENYAKMSIETVKYGVAKEGATKGDDSWAQDTEVCEEKNSAGYLAASLGSFAVALAVMNF